MKTVQRRRCSGDESSHAAAAVPSVFASVHRPRHAGISAFKNNPQQHQRPQHRPTYQQYQQQRRLLQQQHQKHQQSQLEFASGHNAAYEQRQQPHLSSAAAAEATTAKQSIALPIAPPPAAPSLSATGKQMQQINANMQRQRHPHDVPPTQSSRIPVQQHQQQQQQQQQSHQQNFNQISNTATHLLSGIYEKHLLSQTAFRDNEQQQQHRPGLAGSNKQMQQWPTGSPRLPGVGELNLSNYVVTGRREQQQQPQRAVAVVHAPLHAPKQQQQQKPVHFLRLPPPPPAPPVPLAMTDAQQQATAHTFQQQFPFSDGCVEPAAMTASSRQHFLFESLPSPPPPPVPLNHVYETIKERPPLPTPPAPPERPKPVAAKADREAPPLPPSRHLKKRSALAAGNSSGRPPKGDAKKCLPVATDAANTCGNATQELWETKKQHSKMLPMQPPSYVHPPAAVAATKQQLTTQYNTQQRTKADGEQNPRIYMQLRDQQQLQQGHVQHPAKLNAQQQQQHKQQLPHLQLPVLAPAQPILQQRHPSHIQMREHPVGAIDAKPKSASIAASESSPAAAATAIIGPSCSAIGVEQALQHAGLLQPTSSYACPVLPSSSAAPLPLFTANSTAHNNRPSALSIVFEEDTGEFQDVLVLEQDGTAKLPYRHGKIEVRLETAQAMAAAAYYARAAQKLAQSGSTRTRSAEMQTTSARNGGFCGALQRTPPPVPSSLARRLANKENFGIGKVKVMLRVSDTHVDTENPHFMSVDKKKRQVTLTDPTAASSVAASTSQERGPMVAAPKMFAFDSLFTAEDQQSDICASALSEVIPAVLEGSDGCLLTIGYPSSGQSQTMLGGVNPPGELGAIPCAISWLYKGINERRQRSGARFSVRVSALGVSATKPDSSSKDLLAAHATESDDSPGIYLRDDFLGGPTELRAPTAERAALFLDAALAGRAHGGLQPAMIFTLHVYQYSLSRKGGVAGGRSRLHLIDLGGCANRNGGLPLSGVGNILLAILSGQRHPPNKDHPLTPLLKDCLAPLTCHVAIMAHVTHTQSHTDALTTIQLASRIHRMRRRKHRFPLPSDKAATGLALNGGHQSTGSSAGSGADPSSSELSADTVIYMGPSDDATDGEHPPVYLPSLSSGDNRGVMSKVLKGSGLEKQQPPAKAANATKKSAVHKAPQSPVIASRTDSLKRGRTNSPIPQQPSQQQSNNEAQFYSPAHSLQNLPHSVSSPKIVAGSLRHPSMAMMSSKGSNMPSPKGSPLRRPGVGCGGLNASEQVDCPGSPMRKITEEQWIDGPRVSRAKVAEARHLLREVNHVKQCETWIDGPKSQSSRSLTAGNLPTAPSQVQGYGFMDSHKKSMIRQWVENQTSQVFQSASAASSPTHGAHRDQQAQHLRNITFHMSQLKQKSLDAPEDLYASSTRQPQQLLNHQSSDQHSLRSIQLGEELVHPIGAVLTAAISTTNASAPAEIRGSTLYRQRSGQGHSTSSQNQTKDETDFLSTHSLHSNGCDYDAASITNHLPIASASDAAHHSDRQADQDEDQDSGPSEVPPALPLIEPLGSREISHESLHRILSRHVSRESLYQQQTQDIRRQEEITIRSSSRQSLHHHSQHSMSMSDCGLQVTEEEIARTMAGEHPLAALSHCDNMSIVSSFHMAGDAFSDCAMGERTRNQFDQLARLREIFTSQLAMAEVTPVFRSGCDVGSVYSEPAYRFNTGPGSVCSEPPYRLPSPRQLSRSPSQGSLPSLNGIMQIAGMEQYASLRHPDGASDPNLPKMEKPFVVEHEEICDVDEKSALLSSSKRPLVEPEHTVTALQHSKTSALPVSNQSQLPLLPLNTSSEAYDSGHDSSTPRTSKHSGISRRAESGYHSVATARDSDESSFTSGLSKEHHNRITVKKRRQDKGLCNWLMNPFTCTYPETEGEISDF